jgi:hypothetical protein
MQTLWTVFQSFAAVTHAPMNGPEDAADRSRQENFRMQLYWIPAGCAQHPRRVSAISFLSRYRESKNEELFKIVTGNAADMIALVDTKGRRLRNSCQWAGAK